jgi:hypothetical protein
VRLCQYIHIPPWHELRHPRCLSFWGVGIFRNKPGVKVGRWGFCFYGFEFGSRNPCDPVGIFLKRVGLWPW